MPNEKKSEANADDGMDGLKRVATPYLTWAAVAFSSSGATLAVSPFVSEEVLGELRHSVVQLESENRILRSELKHLEREISKLPPEWLRREIDKHEKQINRHEDRLDKLERGG